MAFASRVYAQEPGCTGSVDPSFVTPQLTASPTFCVDGNEVIAAGSGCIFRVRENGSLDLSFLASFTNGSDSGFISTILKDSAGNWVIAGRFSMVNSSSRPNIARLLPDGAVDLGFSNSAFSLSTNCFVNAMALQPDGKLLVAGALWSGSYPAPGFITRLQTDGTVEAAFNIRTTTGGPISAIALQPDGRILVAGSFTNFAGKIRNQLCRIESDGSIDNTFNPSQFMPYVSGLKLLASGDILIHWAGGAYAVPLDPTVEPLPPTNSLVRLHGDGSLDTTFASAGAGVSSIAVQTDGKYILTGNFAGNTDANRLCKRILPDGAEDPTFVSLLSDSDNNSDFNNSRGGGSVIVSSGFSSSVIFHPPTIKADSIALDAKQRIFVSGFFPTVNHSTPSLVRLLNDSDSCVPAFSFETNQMIFVGTNALAVIPVVRTGDLSSTASVQVYNPGLAYSQYEFAPLETNITFGVGVSRQNIIIPLKDNHYLEANQQFTLTLHKASPLSLLGLYKSLQVTVIDGSTANLPGAADINFKADLGDFPYEGSIVITPDQKIVIAGGFSTINGVPTPSLGRLNSNGSIDSSFHSEIPGVPVSIAGFSDKLYVVTRSNYYTNSLVRVLSNGAIDSTFSPSILTSFLSERFRLCASVDGKILAAGLFTNLNGINVTNRLVRFNSDGSLDTSFNAAPPLNGSDGYGIYAILELPDHSYLIGGNFSQIAGQAPVLAHISSSGALLGDFQISRQMDYSLVRAIGTQPDGSVIVAGDFDFDNGSDQQYVLRFNPNGTLDASFHPPSRLFAGCRDVVVQRDGKIILTGAAYGYGVDIKRLNADGSLDPTFYVAQIETNYGPTESLALDDSGYLYVRGAFSSFNRLPRVGLIRLHTGDYSGPGVFTISGPNAVFEDEGSVKVTVRRDWSIKGEARLHLKTQDGSAISGQDYVGIETPVVFADGEGGEKQFEIPLIDNPSINDTSPYFYTSITGESPDIIWIPGSDSVATSIKDDDPGFILSNFPEKVAEGETASFDVRRIGRFAGPATVDIATEGGTAIPGVDHLAIAQTLYFVTSNSYAHIILGTADNNVIDDGKTIRVVLSNPTSPYSLLAPSTNTLTIVGALERFAFVPSTIDAVQNESAVQLSIQSAYWQYGRPNRSVTISYQTDAGTAIPGVEYVPQKRSITFGPNDAAPKQILIPLLPNSIIGDPTTIGLNASVTDGEATFTNSATIFLHHPKAVIPAGSVDTAFSSAHDEVSGYSFYIASFGNYLYARGDFHWPFIGSTNRHSLVRFDLTGALDHNYYLDLQGFPILPVDGRTLVQSTSGASPKNIIRIDASGAIAPNFSVQLPDFYKTYHLALTPSGNIIIAGLVQPSGVYSSFPFLTQLHPDGAPDQSFGIVFLSASSAITALAIDADGRILVGGQFSEISGIRRSNIVRLTAEGHVDLSFSAPPNFVGYVGAIHVLSTGKIFASGWFPIIPESPTDMVRFNPDGSLDNDFNPPAPNGRDFLTVDGQDRIYIRTLNRLGSEFPYRVSRLSQNGAPDPDFFAADWIADLKSTPDGLFAPSGISCCGYPILAHVYGDPPTALRVPELLPNNRIAHTFNFPSNTPYILEQTTDFVTWTELSSGSTSDGYVRLETDAPDSVRFYRVRSQ